MRFPLVWQRIGVGFGNTLQAAVFAIISSLLVGSCSRCCASSSSAWLGAGTAGCRAGAYLRRGLNVLLSAMTRVYVEVFRGMPVVITIFFVARGFPELGIASTRSGTWSSGWPSTTPW